MPQFDVFLFFPSIFYLLIVFVSLMFYNQLNFLPRVSSVLKLREKLNNVRNKSNSSFNFLKLYKMSSKIN